MSYTSTSACNLALIEIKVDIITDITDETTKESRTCNLVYEPTRKAFLEAHTWQFAERTVDLALETTTPVGYTYAYGYPTDALFIRRIYNSSTGVIDYILQAAADKNSKEIWTDEATAKLQYTADITNLNVFSPLAFNAFIYALAAKLAPTLATESIAKEMETKYLKAMILAMASDARQKKELNKYPDNPLRSARL